MRENMSFSMEEGLNQRLSSVRTNILSSWERCINNGLLPQDPPKIEAVSSMELDNLFKENQHLIQISMPYLRRIRSTISQHHSIITLCNKKCTVFYKLGYAPSLAKLGIHVGHIVNEENLGTNCLGTCLAVDEPTMVFGKEHFLEVFKDWAGFAMPIHGLDGATLGALGVYVPAKFASQNMLGMVMIACKGIEKEMELIDKNLELTTLNELLSDFSDDIVNTASMLSHEIRNSLSTISAYVQLLQLERILDSSRADRILMEVTRVNKLLNDFRRLTKPSHMNFSRCSLNILVRYTVDVMSPKANMEQVDIKLTMPKEDIFAKVDRDSMQQVFANLIENAIQAMEKGGTLSIRLLKEKESNKAVIEFQDTGVGIPEENLSEIFKLFYTSKKTGSGLGLILCQNIIKNHRGYIRVRSKVGAGTTFSVEIPCIE